MITFKVGGKKFLIKLKKILNKNDNNIHHLVINRNEV